MDKLSDSVMTSDDLSAYLKIAKSTLHKLAQEGIHWRFRRKAVDRWLEQNMSSAAVERGSNVNS
jgi:post-segregation antitoxin (ccd killing protein)